MNTLSKSNDAALSDVVIMLMKDVVYREDGKHWSSLLSLQGKVRDYMSTMRLDLAIDENEGYAYLKSQDEVDDEIKKVRRLVSRRPLSHSVTLMLALLRKRLTEFDSQGDQTRLILSCEDLVIMMSPFLPMQSNEAKTTDQIHGHISKVVALGFLRKLKTDGVSPVNADSYEVMRILKAFVDAQWLGDFNDKLTALMPKTSASVL
jgi:hypothetical protein